VMFLGSNGAKDRWPAFLTMTATETITSTVISMPKNRPASLVETETPRIIMYTASAVKMTVKIPQGMFTWR